MIEVAYSPVWFYGIDIVIDIISIIVLLCIALFSFKYYKLSGNRNYRYLGMSLIVIAAAFLFKILTNFTLHTVTTELKRVGALTLTLQTVQTSDAFYILGFFAYRVLTLLGWYLYYWIFHEKRRWHFALTAYFIITLMYFTFRAHYVFYFTAAVILSLIAWEQIGNYIKDRKNSQLLLAASFITLILSHMVYIFIGFYNWLYPAAGLIQLAGYSILLITFIKVQYGSKKG